MFEIPPDRALTLPEEYALVAAIHEEGGKGRKRIPPWRWRGIRYAAVKSGLPFEVLRTRVSTITDQDAQLVRDAVRAVRKDLRAVGAVETPASGRNQFR